MYDRAATANEVARSSHTFDASATHQRLFRAFVLVLRDGKFPLELLEVLLLRAQLELILMRLPDCKRGIYKGWKAANEARDGSKEEGSGGWGWGAAQHERDRGSGRGESIGNPADLLSARDVSSAVSDRACSSCVNVACASRLRGRVCGVPGGACADASLKLL